MLFGTDWGSRRARWRGGQSRSAAAGRPCWGSDRHWRVLCACVGVWENTHRSRNRISRRSRTGGRAGGDAGARCCWRSAAF